MSKRARSAPSSHAEPVSWRGRSAVALHNDEIEVVIVAGGGHIVSLKRVDGPLATVNALWEPPWPTTDPALRRLKGQGDLESMLLAGIGGANLCCDVFGEHSKGEQDSGLAFHGEAGLTTWEVEEWSASTGALVLSAHLRRSQLMIKRTFSLRGPVVAIKEELTNLCAFERAMGRCQHVTIGEDFIIGKEDGKEGRGDAAKCHFTCNADRGHTWPVDHDPNHDLNSQWKPNVEFELPFIPVRQSGGQSGGQSGLTQWGNFPNQKVSWNSDLCTLRIDPAEKWGGFAARRTSDLGMLTLGATWLREDFPWLMTWDENRARKQEPWNGQTLCRGLEISSYAFATSRRENVERGKLLGQPTFEWLDANESKITTWYLSLQLGSPPRFGGAGQKDARELCRAGFDLT